MVIAAAVEKEESSLTAFLKHNSDLTYSVIEQGGNHGDSLIYAGMREELNRHNIEYELIQYRQGSKHRTVRRLINERLHHAGVDWVPFEIPKIDDADIILINGGANLNDLWPHALVILKSLLKSCDIPIVIAPQTYWFPITDFEAIFDGVTQPVHLFARERYSKRLLDGYEFPSTVSTYLSPDTAFYNTPEELMANIDQTTATSRGHSLEHEYELAAFRDDKERLVSDDIIFGIRERPVKTLVGDVSLPPQTYSDFITIICNADVVYTDRLHVSILASLFGIETYVYQGAYFKTQGVYNYSMAHMDHVHFHTSD